MKVPTKMTLAYWNDYLANRLALIKSVLGEKAAQYARNDDRMHNFNLALQRSKNETREDAIAGMALKHMVSIEDIRTDLREGKLPSKELVEEKYGDAINYLLLEEASVLHTLDTIETAVGHFDYAEAVRNVAIAYGAHTKVGKTSEGKGYAYGLDSLASSETEGKIASEWFELLPSAYKFKARFHIDPQRVDTKHSSLSDALSYSFNWNATPEGRQFWHDLHERALAGEFDNGSAIVEGAKSLYKGGVMQYGPIAEPTTTPYTEEQIAGMSCKCNVKDGCRPTKPKEEEGETDYRDTVL